MGVLVSIVTWGVGAGWGGFWFKFSLRHNTARNQKLQVTGQDYIFSWIKTNVSWRKKGRKKISGQPSIWPQGYKTFFMLNSAEHEFVCVEVLRPSQPNGVMSSAVSLPNHTFTGQA